MSDAISDYQAALKACLAEPEQLAPAQGDPAERGFRAFEAMFADLSPGNIKARLPEVYAERLFFNDTLKTVRDRDSLLEYMLETADNVEACSAEMITRYFGEYEVIVRWQMRIRFKQFARGEDTWSIGMSHLLFNRDAQIVLHQDYWDASRGLFEHVPVLGRGIRAIRRRV